LNLSTDILVSAKRLVWLIWHGRGLWA